MPEKAILASVRQRTAGVRALCTTFHAQTRVTVGGASASRSVKPLLHGRERLEWVVPEPTSPTTKPVSPALLAFLRGIECRAWVFALAQCGDAGLADSILASAIGRFAGAAPSQPLAQWPLRFWSILVGQPAMHAIRGDGDELATLAPGPRAALLLRVVAGLDPAHAMQVLGVSAAAHGLALRRAQALWPDDDHGVERLRDRLHTQVQQMTQAQREHVVALRDRALAAAPPAGIVPSAHPASGGVWRSLPKILLVLLLLGFAATFYPTLARQFASGSGDATPPAAATPGSQLAETAVVIHPDYEQLAAPEDDALARQLAFLSWVEAGGEVQGAAVPAAPGLSETSTAETAAADGDVETAR